MVTTVVEFDDVLDVVAKPDVCVVATLVTALEAAALLLDTTDKVRTQLAITVALEAVAILPDMITSLDCVASLDVTDAIN